MSKSAFVLIFAGFSDVTRDSFNVSANFWMIGMHLFRECFEITHNESDFAPTYKFREIVENTIEENDVYRNAGLKYDSRFLDFLKRRYGLMATQSRKHSRKRGFEGILHHEWF